MSRYTRVTLNPTEGQLADLSAGEAVRLSPQHFEGNCPLHLTKSQMKGIHAAHKAGKGYTLKLSKAQIAFCNKNGSGLLKDLLKGGIKVTTPYASRLAQRGADKLVNAASNTALRLVGDGSQQGAGWLGNIGKWLGHSAVDGIASVLGGSVQKKGRVLPPCPPRLMKIQDQSIADTAPMHGGSWFGDAGKWLGHTAVDGIAAAMGGSMIDPEMMAALKQKKVRVARGKGLVL